MDTCPRHTCVRHTRVVELRKRGRETRDKEGELGGKEKKTSDMRETSDNIQRMKLMHVSPDNACHLYC